MQGTFEPLKTLHLGEYFPAFDSIEGFLSPDAALLFFLYASLDHSLGIRGDTLEIGVHHGLSAIAVASLRGAGRRFVAIDLFDSLQELNSSRSGAGVRSVFETNMRRFHPDLSFVDVVEGPSTSVDAAQFGRGFSFCHVDGGHSAEETYHDLALCADLLLPGGILALDDYFNSWFPGVCEGAVRYSLEHPSTYRPLAVGFNKVILRRLPEEVELDLDTWYPGIPRATVTFWGRPTACFTASPRGLFDLDASTSECLVRREGATVRAVIEPRLEVVRMRPGETARVGVRIANVSTSGLTFVAPDFGLSYHLLSAKGAMLEFEHPRTRFFRPVAPGSEDDVELAIRAPETTGTFLVDVDVVWEGVTWLASAGATAPGRSSSRS